MSIILARRGVLAAIPLGGALAAAGATSARADTADLVLNCDTALSGAMAAVSAGFTAKTGVRIRIFPTAPGLLLPQLERQIQNDLIVSRTDIVEQAARQGLLQPGSQVGVWLNRLVLVGMPGSNEAALKGRVAAVDPTAGSGFDGSAILARLQSQPAKIIGCIDEDDVLGALRRGEADAGLVYLTAARANPSMTILARPADDVAPPARLSAAATILARHASPSAFTAFLADPGSVNLLHAAGLELVA